MNIYMLPTSATPRYLQNCLHALHSTHSLGLYPKDNLLCALDFTHQPNPFSCKHGAHRHIRRCRARRGDSDAR